MLLGFFLQKKCKFTFCMRIKYISKESFCHLKSDKFQDLTKTQKQNPKQFKIIVWFQNTQKLFY
jgi:hypothetical protein